MDEFTASMTRLGMVPYEEQRTILARLADDMVAGGISLVEAPPATGKTYAMAWHALDTARKTGERVLIAVPTIAVMRQALTSIRTLSAFFPEVESVGVYGRQEFVHGPRADAWILAVHPDAHATYLEWQIEQADGGWTRASLDAFLLERGYDLDLPLETSLLAGRRTDAEASYRNQFETTAGVVVATHAFLARDVAARIGRVDADAPRDKAGVIDANERRLAAETADDRILPEWRHLLVDEAHLLPSGVMNALSTQVSFRQLLSILDDMVAEGVDVSRSRIETLRLAVTNMEEDAPSGILRSRRLHGDIRTHMALVRCVEQAVTEELLATHWNVEDLNYLRRFRESAIMAQRRRREASPSITWSDVHGHLSLRIAPVTVFRQMDYLWRSCRSAALVSATLLSQDDDEGPAAHLVRQTGLPVDRVVVHEPFDSAWTRRPVVVHLPDMAFAAGLVPGDRERDGSVAGVIDLAAADSIRGMLVLFTSHDSIANTASMLEDLGDRVMTTDTRGVQAAARRFVEAARDGRRPVWLATGPAWTGLDIPTDALDTVLIARLPYGMVNPIMHEHMLATVKSAATFRDYETDMLRMLRQGIGRLVRSRDLDEDRMLWLADGRLVGRRAGIRAMSLLSSYDRCVEYG